MLKPHIYKLMIPQHVLYILGIVTIFVGITSPWYLLYTLLGYVILGYIGTSVFIHRYWCHNSFKTHPYIAYAGAYLGLLCGSGSPIPVEAIHMRLHHAHADKAKDPHTPTKGKMWSWFYWHNMTIEWPRLNRKLLRDPVLKFMHKKYFKIWWTTFIVLALVNWQFAIFFMLGAGVYNFHLEGLINTFGHSKEHGERPAHTNDNSVNLRSKVLMVFSLGNSLHQNHHLYPMNYTYYLRKGEFDFAKYFVPLIKTD